MELDYTMGPDGFWQGRLGSVHFGCIMDYKALGLAEQREVTQVHGTTLLTDLTFTGSHQEADGLISDQAEVALAAKTADCVPVHLTDGRRIAVIHAGWRGTAQGIVEKLMHHFDLSKVHVVIGPSISGENYEVDADLYQDWLKREPELAAWLMDSPKGGTKRHLYLREFIAQKFQRAKVPDHKIILIPGCTFASETLPSYRRQGIAKISMYNYIYRHDSI